MDIIELEKKYEEMTGRPAPRPDVEHMRGPLLRYLVLGIQPGSFLTAALSNNFVEAFTRADEDNTNAMRNWAYIIYSEIPTGAWGSEEKVHNWVERYGLAGVQEKQEAEENVAAKR